MKIKISKISIYVTFGFEVIITCLRQHMLYKVLDLPLPNLEKNLKDSKIFEVLSFPYFEKEIKSILRCLLSNYIPEKNSKLYIFK